MLDQRAPAQGLDRLQHNRSPYARAQRTQQCAEAHRLALNREQTQDLLLERGAAFDLLGEQPPNAPEDTAVTASSRKAAMSPAKTSRIVSPTILSARPLPPTVTVNCVHCVAV